MTTQEIAVALSHIEVWRLIADGDVPATLVLEDDIFMPAGFVRNLQKTWSALNANIGGEPDFDLLYLSFKDVGNSRSSPHPAEPLRRPSSGIWFASGYVLSREGARRLLKELPVCGPVDLWLNLQFKKLRVFTSARPIIEQRINEPSTNSYSVLPILSQVGAITREKPLLTTYKRLHTPVVAVGSHGSGLTPLATALSMVGYTCCSDIDRLTTREEDMLLTGRGGRLFNAYVNVGSLGTSELVAIAKANPSAKFVVTSRSHAPPESLGLQMLHLDDDVDDKWAALCRFLDVEYPSFPYPVDDDIGQRSQVNREIVADVLKSTDLKFDKSPWILRARHADWNGLSVGTNSPPLPGSVSVNWAARDSLDPTTWKLRTHTFPSNLALFRSANFRERPGTHATLTFRDEPTRVRQFTSAAIASRKRYLYGAFRAELRASNVPGLITGLFVHRNSPRQEIDIEFLGKDTTKMLINVFYNPGPEGTKLEYGYRGSPTLIDLGFDAAATFHAYEIEWQPNAIRWKVDGAVVHERLIWNPTPIPDQALEFNVNLWHSRSAQLAGHLATGRVPAVVELRSIEVESPCVAAVAGQLVAQPRVRR